MIIKLQTMIGLVFWIIFTLFSAKYDMKRMEDIYDGVYKNIE